MLRSKHPLYHTYMSMRSRCINRMDPAWFEYGKRGIALCSRWLHGEGNKDGFACFVEDMGERPIGHTLDRKNNDGNYEPLNCRWATTEEQLKNRKRSPDMPSYGELTNAAVERAYPVTLEDERRYAERMWA